MMWWHDGGWDAGTWFLMSLMMIMFWGGLIGLGVWLVHSLRSARGPAQPLPPPVRPSSTATADEVLAERFARGEIDEDEFKRRRALLHSGSPSL